MKKLLKRLTSSLSQLRPLSVAISPRVILSLKPSDRTSPDGPPSRARPISRCMLSVSSAPHRSHSQIEKNVKHLELTIKQDWPYQKFWYKQIYNRCFHRTCFFFADFLRTRIRTNITVNLLKEIRSSNSKSVASDLAKASPGALLVWGCLQSPRAPPQTAASVAATAQSQQSSTQLCILVKQQKHRMWMLTLACAFARTLKKWCTVEST